MVWGLPSHTPIWNTVGRGLFSWVTGWESTGRRGGGGGGMVVGEDGAGPVVVRGNGQQGLHMGYAAVSLRLMLRCVTVCGNVWRCVAVCGRGWRCGALSGSVLQCVAHLLAALRDGPQGPLRGHGRPQTAL